MILILTEVRWNLNVIFFFNLFTIFYFSFNLFAISSSFENYLFDSFAHLLIRLFFYCLIFGVLYESWIFFDEYRATTFSHSVDCLLTLIIFSFTIQKPFNLIQSHLAILVLTFWAIGIPWKVVAYAFICVSMYFQSSFKVSSLTLRTLIHF
jgi:hypothetical protein